MLISMRADLLPKQQILLKHNQKTTLFCNYSHYGSFFWLLLALNSKATIATSKYNDDLY